MSTSAKVSVTGSALKTASRGRRQGRQFAAWINGSSWVISLLALLPLGFVIFIAIQSGWDSIVQLVFRPRVAELCSTP